MSGSAAVVPEARTSQPDEWAREDLWWPLALASEVESAGRTPVAVTLLSVPWAIVVMNGQVSALKDLCPHRRVPLSAGTVADGPQGQLLECGYHGWSFDGDGACARIPALGEGRPPRGMGGTPVVATSVHAGLIWGSHALPGDFASADHDVPAVPLLRSSQRVAAPAFEVARALAGPGAAPGRILRVAGSERGLMFAIRPETAASSVVFPMTESASFTDGHQEWVQILGDRAPPARSAAPAEQHREER